MLITSKFAHQEVREHEAEILLALLPHFPEGGYSLVGLKNFMGRHRFRSEYLSLLLSRLACYNIVESFFELDDAYKVYYRLTTDGWLKAVTLESVQRAKVVAVCR